MTYQRDFITDADGTLLDITAGGEMKTADATAQASLGSINTLIDNAKDDLTGLIGTIDVVHHEIHEGEHFFIQNYIEVVGSGVLNHVWLTGAKDVHMTFSVNGADAGIILQTYEGVTADSDGTLLTPLNNKRESLTASTVTVRRNPGNIVTTNATLLRSSRLGTSGGVAQRTSGNIDRGNEAILKKNTKYLVRVTNLSSSANNINVDYQWYEQ